MFRVYVLKLAFNDGRILMAVNRSNFEEAEDSNGRKRIEKWSHTFLAAGHVHLSQSVSQTLPTQGHSHTQPA